MAVITEEAIQELAALKGRGGPITSLYLDVDGRRLVRRQDLELELDAVLRSARRRANGYRSVQDDLARIEAYVREGLDRHRTRGVAIFAGGADDIWHVYRLAVPVRSQVVINEHPAVGQLEALVQDHESLAVLLADRQRARLFLFRLGELVERSELLDELPRAVDVRGLRERGTPDAHVEEVAHQHLRRAARAAFELWQQHQFRHLAIGAPDRTTALLEGELHPYLRERLCGRLSVAVDATEGEVQAAAEEVAAEVERRREDELVQRLRSEVGAGRRGVAGLGPVLEALAAHRVEHLLVSRGYREEGWRCPSTGALAAKGPTDPATGEPMERIDDVVEEAVDEAIARRLPVTICTGNADLDVLGRIGALLRY